MLLISRWKQHSFSLEMLIQQSWKQLISNFFFFYLIGCQMQNFLWQKAPPVKGNPLTSQVPDNLFCGVFRETELPVFPTTLKQEWQKDDAELASTVRAPGIPFAKWIPAAPQNSLQPSEMANWAWYLVAACTEASNESQSIRSCLMRGCNSQGAADIESLVILMTPVLWQCFWA